MANKQQNQDKPKTKKMVIVKGRGTRNETRITTDIDMYWNEARQVWVTIP